MLHAEVNARMMGIYAGVKDKKVRDAAWKYIEAEANSGAWRNLHQRIQKVETDGLVSIKKDNVGDFCNVYTIPARAVWLAAAYVYFVEGVR